MGQLRLFARRHVVEPDVSDAALGVQVVERPAVWAPHRVAAVALVADEGLEFLRRRQVHPDLPGCRPHRVQALAVEFVAATRKQNSRTVRTHHGVRSRVVEHDLLRLALLRRNHRNAFARFRPGLVAVDLAQDVRRVRTPRARIRRLRVESNLPHRVARHVELEHLHAAVAVGREDDFETIRTHHRPGVCRRRRTNAASVPALRVRYPQVVVPFEHETLAVAAHAWIGAEIYARPIVDALRQLPERRKRCRRRDCQRIYSPKCHCLPFPKKCVRWMRKKKECI